MEPKFFSIDMNQESFRNEALLPSDFNMLWEDMILWNGRYYWVGEMLTNYVVAEHLSREDYDNGYVRNQTRTFKLEEVKTNQAAAYAEIEGENDVNFKKARTRAYVDNDMSYFDKLNFQKAQVRTLGNDLEQELITAQTLEEVNAISTEIIYDSEPVIEFVAITVGSFIDRFTSNENSAIIAFMAENPELSLRYDAMKSRTHINLNDQGLCMLMTLISQEELLSTDPEDLLGYENRLEAILRPGASTEAWRPTFS